MKTFELNVILSSRCDALKEIEPALHANRDHKLLEKPLLLYQPMKSCRLLMSNHMLPKVCHIETGIILLFNHVLLVMKYLLMGEPIGRLNLISLNHVLLAKQ